MLSTINLDGGPHGYHIYRSHPRAGGAPGRRGAVRSTIGGTAYRIARSNRAMTVKRGSGIGRLATGCLPPVLYSPVTPP